MNRDASESNVGTRFVGRVCLAARLCFRWTEITNARCSMTEGKIRDLGTIAVSFLGHCLSGIPKTFLPVPQNESADTTSFPPRDPRAW